MSWKSWPTFLIQIHEYFHTKWHYVSYCYSDSKTRIYLQSIQHCPLITSSRQSESGKEIVKYRLSIPRQVGQTVRQTVRQTFIFKYKPRSHTYEIRSCDKKTCGLYSNKTVSVTKYIFICFLTPVKLLLGTNFWGQ